MNDNQENKSKDIQILTYILGKYVTILVKGRLKTDFLLKTS